MFSSQLKNHTIDLSRYKTINQTAAASTVSERYKFISTAQVLEVLADHGWRPVKVSEAGTRIPEKKGYQKHAITLANDRVNHDLQVGQTMPRVMLTNSHSGSAAFTFHLALLELVCKNGLLVSHGDQAFKVAHRSYADLAVEEALKYVTKGLFQAFQQVDRYRSIVLNEIEREQFALEAIEARWDGEKYVVNPSDLLYARRTAQRDKTLWNTFNVVQEAVIRGGIWQRRRNNTRVRSRAIKGIDQSIRLNKRLWEVMEGFANRRGVRVPSISTSADSY